MTTQLLEYTGNQFVAELSNVVVYICLAVAILSIVYAVYIAYLFFTASDQNKRKAAKDRLIKTIASCLIIFTAAAILKGLDISFNGTGGDYKGTEEPDQPVIQTYHYDGTPVFNLVKKDSVETHGVTINYYEGEFNFGSLGIVDDIKNESVFYSGKNIRIIRCNIVNPSGWLKNLNDETEGGSITHSPERNDATAVFNYRTSYGGSFKFPCFQEGNDNDLYVMAEVKFLMYLDEDLDNYGKNTQEAISNLMGLVGAIKTVYIKAKFQPNRGNVEYKVSYIS